MLRYTLCILLFLLYSLQRTNNTFGATIVDLVIRCWTALVIWLTWKLCYDLIVCLMKTRLNEYAYLLMYINMLCNNIQWSLKAILLNRIMYSICSMNDTLSLHLKLSFSSTFVTTFVFSFLLILFQLFLHTTTCALRSF